MRKNSLIEVSLSNIIKEERVGKVTWQTVALLVVQITPDTVLLLQCIGGGEICLTICNGLGHNNTH